MPEDTESLERALAAELATLDDRLIDEKFCSELYRALTNNEWRREGLDGAIALSWSRAERLVDDLRSRVDRPALRLAQTGGEGEVSDTVQAELGRLGWSHRPLDTHHHDAHHVSEPVASPPPPEAALRHAPPGAQTEEERFHEAERLAEINRLLPEGERIPATLASRMTRKG